DNYRFIVHELFLFVIAGFLKFERFEVVGQLIEPYYVSNMSSPRGAVLQSFTILEHETSSLDARNSRLKLNRMSLRADLLKSRVAGSHLNFEQVMQADFLLYLRALLSPKIERDWQRPWVPYTLLYAVNRYSPFEIFAKAESAMYAEKLRPLF